MVTKYAIPSVDWKSDPTIKILETKSMRLRSTSRSIEPSGCVMSILPCFVRKKTHIDRHRDKRAWPANPTIIYLCLVQIKFPFLVSAYSPRCPPVWPFPLPLARILRLLPPSTVDSSCSVVMKKLWYVRRNIRRKMQWTSLSLFIAKEPGPV